IKPFVFIITCILYRIYLIPVVNYKLHLPSGECEFDWCDGLGMLILVLAFTYFGLIYYHIIKKYFGSSINEKVIKPAGTKFLEDHDVKFGWVILKIIICLIPLIAALVYIGVDTIGSSHRLISLLGLFVILAFGFLFSKHPRKIRWRPVLCGLGIQFVMGLLTIRWTVGRNIFQCIGDKATIFLGYADEGSTFVYGEALIKSNTFAFQALSVIFFMSFMVQILYYYGAMQFIIVKLGWFLQTIMGTTVCESINASASVFLGMSESPLLVKPYLKDLTKSEMHAIMTGGFATVAGSVLAAYISFGVSAAHLITASVMSAPAALCYAKLFYPETEESRNRSDNIVIEKTDDSSALDAATKGALAGIHLVLGIIANIIAFIAFIAFLNGLLSWLGMLVGVEGFTFEFILGKVFIPLAWIMGVQASECEEVARLIGIKTIVNEFVAYEQLGKVKSTIVSKRKFESEMIATYALCGFANPSSLGILIGALITMAPNQRTIITEVAFRAFIAGSATCFLTACIAGILMPDDYYYEFTGSDIPIFSNTSTL
ncbi:hypothetical protein L9F63_002310, partial [Diploptera punctata]